MVTEQYSIEPNVVLQESGLSISTPAYPVNLSLFLTPPDTSLVSSEEGHDLVMQTQYALEHWNRYVASGEKEAQEAFLKMALWLVEHAQHIRDESAGWPITYIHPLYPTRGSWLSAIAQGCGLSVLVRAYQLTNEQHFLATAHRVARTFARDILDGGVCAPIGADGIFFEEVAVYPAAHTLHGAVFALLGLHDYGAITGNVDMREAIQRGEITLHNLFDEFDCGFWTRTDLLRHDLATSAQLAQHVALLEALANCTGCAECATRASRWQRYQNGLLPRIQYAFTRRVVLFKQALLRRVRAVILPQPSAFNQQSGSRLPVCVPLPSFPFPGGIQTFLDRVARVMEDRWQMTYVTQNTRPDEEERVIHQFGRAWMTPWHFPQVWFYMLAGTFKLLSLLHQGANYGLVISQDAVFSGTFATLVGKLTGVRVICFEHSTLTWYRSQVYHNEKQRNLDSRGWPWLLRQLIQLSLTLYWPSLYFLTRFATAQADHFLSPGVPGDEIEEICQRLRIPASRMTRFNITVDINRHAELSAEERAARRVGMGIPIDALVIAITVRLGPEKGLEISLESICQVLSSLPAALRDRVRVMIAGDGQLRRWLEQEIEQRELRSVCRMLGHVSNEEVCSLLAVSDISLHTSTRGACMGTAVLEGMAAGCAVISSDQPLASVRLLAEGRGIAVAAGNVEETSRALECLLRDEDLRNSVGKAARAHIALHHSSQALRRVLLRASYWSDLDKLLETKGEH